MKPLSIKTRAIDYRKQGYSYNMISKKLGLSKSTLSDWLREIPYTPNAEVLRRIRKARIKSIQAKHHQKINSINEAKKLAKEEIGRVTKRDLWFLGIGLYLGEGSKFSRESIRIINSNPEVIKLAIKWFRGICGLTTKNFTIAIHAYPDNNIVETINFWSKTTGVPKKQFKKTQIDRRTNKSRIKKGKLPYGTAHLTVKACGKKEFGVFLHRRIMGWIESVLNQILVRE